MPSAVLAAVAGTTLLADASSARTGAFIALIAAALTAVMVTVNAPQRAERSRATANAYLTLRGPSRALRAMMSDARTR